MSDKKKLRVILSAPVDVDVAVRLRTEARRLDRSLSFVIRDVLSRWASWERPSSPEHR